jgi:hypothetical protein
MKRKLKRFVRPIATWLVILQIIIFFLDISTAASRAITPNSGDRYVFDRRANVLKILLVLEDKMGDQQLLERAKDKLFTLSEGQIRLIASLCDRVVKEGNKTAGDISFLLITVLITLL